MAVAEVVLQQEVGRGAFLLVLTHEGLARSSRPGQFALFRCGTRYDPFLPRPLSVHEVDPEAGRAAFLYRVRGEGTRWLARLRPGDEVEVTGPHGRGFSFSGRGKKGLLVAGGIGIAPIFFLARELSALAWELTFVFGARTREELFRWQELAALGEVLLATEDGSAGRAGTAGELLADVLPRGGWEAVFACGPRGLLREVQRFSCEAGIPAQIALEERMACGVGACYGCACRAAGGRGYLRVCSDGPVFGAGEVVLE